MWLRQDPQLRVSHLATTMEVWVIVIIQTHVIQFSGRLHQVPKLSIILDYLYLQIFLTINPNPPCQLFLREETGENSRLSRQSVDELFPHAIRCSIPGLELVTSVVGGRRLDNWVTEALYSSIYNADL